MPDRPATLTDLEQVVDEAITATAAVDHLTDDQAWEITAAVVAALNGGPEDEAYPVTGFTTWEVTQAASGTVLGWAVPNPRHDPEDEEDRQTYLAVLACTPEEFANGKDLVDEVPTRSLAERCVRNMITNPFYRGTFTEVRDYIVQTSRRVDRG